MSDRVIALLFALAALSPLVWLGDYGLFRLTLTASYALAVLGLNLVMGFGGQISLGHGAFYAIGAYAGAILAEQFGWPYWLTFPAAAVLCGGFGLLVGWPALRLRGPYLALVTLALANAVPQLLKHPALEPWTGGVQGVLLSKPEAPFGLPLSADQWLYLVSLVLAGLGFGLVTLLMGGRVGRAIIAVRDNVVAAEAMGIDVARLKTRTFALGAALTGMAGAVGGLAVEFVAPDSFSVLFSISLFVGAVVGGAASIWGAVAGGAFIVAIPALASSLSKSAPGMVYGAVLIAVLYAMPSGAAGLARRLRSATRARAP